MTTPTYDVRRLPVTSGWIIERTDHKIRMMIGPPFASKNQAVKHARLLAGWRGKVTIESKDPQVTGSRKKS